MITLNARRSSHVEAAIPLESWAGSMGSTRSTGRRGSAPVSLCQWRFLPDIVRYIRNNPKRYPFSKRVILTASSGPGIIPSMVTISGPAGRGAPVSWACTVEGMARASFSTFLGKFSKSVFLDNTLDIYSRSPLLPMTSVIPASASLSCSGWEVIPTTTFCPSSTTSVLLRA